MESERRQDDPDEIGGGGPTDLPDSGPGGAGTGEEIGGGTGAGDRLGGSGGDVGGGDPGGGGDVGGLQDLGEGEGDADPAAGGAGPPD